MQRFAMLAATLFSLSGCTTSLAMLAMNGFGACSPQDFRANQYRTTRLYITPIGTPEAKLTQQFGQPHKQYSFQTGHGTTARALYFSTGAYHCRHYSEDDILIITQNNRVTGIGAEYYTSLKNSQSALSTRYSYTN